MSFCSCESGMEEPACFYEAGVLNLILNLLKIIFIRSRFLIKLTSNLDEKAVGEATPRSGVSQCPGRESVCVCVCREGICQLSRSWLTPAALGSALDPSSHQLNVSIWDR